MISNFTQLIASEVSQEEALVRIGMRLQDTGDMGVEVRRLTSISRSWGGFIRGDRLHKNVLNVKTRRFQPFRLEVRQIFRGEIGVAIPRIGKPFTPIIMRSPGTGMPLTKIVKLVALFSQLPKDVAKISLLGFLAFVKCDKSVIMRL